jgi:transcriptional regulator with XRE-family HTH domain
MMKNSIGANIKKFRKQKKLTQQQLADLIGKCFTIVQRYESGAVAPPLSVIEKIASVLEIESSQLLNGEDKFFKADNELFELFNNLNETGKKRLIENARDLNKIYRDSPPEKSL